MHSQLNAISLDDVRISNWSGSIPVVVSLAASSLSSPFMPSPIHAMVSRQSHLHVALKDTVIRMHKFAPTVPIRSLSVLSRIQSTSPERIMDGPTHNFNTDDSVGDAITDNTKDSSEQSSYSTSTGRSAQTKSSHQSTIINSNNQMMDPQHPSQFMYPICWFEDVDTQTPLRWHLFAGVLWDLKSEPKRLPWKIRIHFTQFPPASQILPLEVDPWTSVERVLKNSLKQALFLRYGSAKVAMNLSKQSLEQVWDSILTVNYKLYQNVNQEYLLQHQQHTSTLPLAKLLPVRLLIDSKPPIQKPCNTEDASMTTLGGLLRHWAPWLFPHRQDEPHNHCDSLPVTLSSTCSRTSCRWTIQGLQNLPLTTNLIDLWHSLCHPDHFLYIIVTTTPNVSLGEP